MNDLEEFASETIPVTYCLEDAMSYPQYCYAMPIEHLLSFYFFKQGNAHLGNLAIDMIRRHFRPIESFQRSILTDEVAKEILSGLIKEGVIDGQYHFVAVYRIFTDFCNFPKEYTSFSHRIVELNLKLNGKMLEYNSLYQSVQKGIKTHSVLCSPYKRWTEYKPEKNENYTTFKRQKVVADALIKILRDRKILLIE